MVQDWYKRLYVYADQIRASSTYRWMHSCPWHLRTVIKGLNIETSIAAPMGGAKQTNTYANT